MLPTKTTIDLSTLPKVKLQLVGHDGNAFAILGSFSREAKRAGWPQDAIDQVLDEAKTGDYDHLLQTVMGHCEGHGAGKHVHRDHWGGGYGLR